MTITPSNCPQCGREVESIVQSIPALVAVHRDGDHFEPSGSTDVLWDMAGPVQGPTPDLTMAVCEGGHWFAPRVDL